MVKWVKSFLMYKKIAKHVRSWWMRSNKKFMKETLTFLYFYFVNWNYISFSILPFRKTQFVTCPLHNLSIFNFFISFKVFMLAFILLTNISFEIPNWWSKRDLWKDSWEYENMYIFQGSAGLHHEKCYRIEPYKSRKNLYCLRPSY